MISFYFSFFFIAWICNRNTNYFSACVNWSVFIQFIWPSIFFWCVICRHSCIMVCYGTICQSEVFLLYPGHSYWSKSTAHSPWQGLCAVDLCCRLGNSGNVFFLLSVRQLRKRALHQLLRVEFPRNFPQKKITGCWFVSPPRWYLCSFPRRSFEVFFVEDVVRGFSIVTYCKW